MIGTIRKHSKVMWIVIIAVIIIVFVYWGNPASRNGNIATARDSNYGLMNGQVITPTIFTETAREVSLNYFYNNGAWPGGPRTQPGFNLEEEVYKRFLLIQKMEELGIHVSDDAVAQAASARMRAVNRGNPVPVAEFEKQLLAPQRLTFGDFERYIRHDIAIQQLVSVAGAGGDLVTPQEIEALYRRDFQELSAQIVFFHASTNLTSTTVAPEKLGEFYTNRQAYYRLPDRVQVSYVSFPLSNYVAQAKQELDQITNLSEIVEARYEQLGTNYFSDAKTPEEAKNKIREEFLKKATINAAGKDAAKFDGRLDESKAPYTPEFFIATAKELGLNPEVTAPFSREGAPADLDVNADFVQRAFKLTAEDPLAEPLVGEDHVYVIAFNRQLPSENPPFEAIRARVVQDYHFVEAGMAAQRAGLDFHMAATNGLAAGKSFADLCTQAKVKPASLPPFSLSTRTLPEIERSLDLPTLKRAAFATPPGQVTPLLPCNDGAAVVFIQATLPLDPTAMRTNLPSFTRSVHQVRRGEVFDAWFRREATKAFSTVPYFQRKQAQLSGAAARP